MELQNQNKQSKILVVDDNMINRKLACAILKNNNYDYDVAENGKVAYERFCTGSYDLILMDIQMPIMSGLESTKEIRSFEKKNNVEKPIPIIAVTTFSSIEDKKNYTNVDMNDLLGKPYSADALVKLLDKYLLEHNN